MERSISKGISLIAALFALCALVFIAGCSGQQGEASSDQSEEAPAADVIVGEESDTTATIMVEDGMGVAITNIAITPTDSKLAPTYLMKEGDAWADGQLAQVFYQDEGDVAYNIQLTCGEKNYEVHNVELASLEGITLCLQDDVAYVSYESDGETVDTLAAETELHQAELKAQEEAEAAAAAAAEEAAAAEAEEAAAEDEGSYEEYAQEDYYYEEPAQAEDSCVEGGVQLR